jgi:ATP-dependent Clp protease adaptor protein ClpS
MWHSICGVNVTKTKKAEETSTATRVRPEPPWNVILHNDWENLVTRVVWVLLVRVIPGMTDPTPGI